MQGRRPARLPLCDFSQSRLLINFQIINLKVRVTPFHSGAADKSVPHQHSRQVAPGQADTRGLNPKPRPPATAAPMMPRQFQSRRKSMPSKSASSTAGGGRTVNCLRRSRTGRRCAFTLTVYYLCRKWRPETRLACTPAADSPSNTEGTDGYHLTSSSLTIYDFVSPSSV